MSAPAGSFYFGLFLGQFDSSYLFTGIYATNTGVNGLFNGGVAAVPGWAAGTSTNYFIVGWDAGMGHEFQSRWLSGFGHLGAFGTSGIGSGISGDGNSIPTLDLFSGGGNTLQTGFDLFGANLVPEPSTAAIATIGGLILLHRTKT